MLLEEQSDLGPHCLLQRRFKNEVTHIRQHLVMISKFLPFLMGPHIFGGGLTSAGYGGTLLGVMGGVGLPGNGE